MYGLALCLPSMGQPQGLPVPRVIPKNPNIFRPDALSPRRVYPRPLPLLTSPPGAGNDFRRGLAGVRPPNRAVGFSLPSEIEGRWVFPACSKTGVYLGQIAYGEQYIRVYEAIQVGLPHPCFRDGKVVRNSPLFPLVLL